MAPDAHLALPVDSVRRNRSPYGAGNRLIHVVGGRVAVAFLDNPGVLLLLLTIGAVLVVLTVAYDRPMAAVLVIIATLALMALWFYPGGHW